MSYTRAQLEQMLYSAAARYGINQAIAHAQIQQESQFNVFAVSGAGARGVAQFMPATAARFGLSNPFDPAASFEAWGKYMSLLLRMFNGRYDLALAGYNSGENRAEYKNAAAQGRAINWSVMPGDIPTQTQHYVKTILAAAGSPSTGTTPSTSFFPSTGADDSISPFPSNDVPPLPAYSTDVAAVALVAAAVVVVLFII
jgi:soluble lytic murein transglycosylase-like protein